MKNILLFFSIFLTQQFSQAETFSPGCYGYFETGLNSINHHLIFRYHDYGSGTVTISIDTSYDARAIINDTLLFVESGIHCINCYPVNVLLYNDTGLYTANFTTCLNTNIEVQYHVTQRASPVSVNELTLNHDLQIYPNPNTGTFTIKNLFAGNNFSLRIFNSIGEMVYQENISEKKDWTINMNFPKGIYFVRLNDVVKKLVIQ